MSDSSFRYILFTIAGSILLATPIACASPGNQPAGNAAGKSSPSGAQRDGSRVATIPVGGGPNFLGLAGGAMWVTTSSGGKVVAIDPATNRVEAKVITGGSPVFLSLWGGDVWVTDSDKARAWQIDPSKKKIAATIPLSGVSYGLAGGFGSMWFAEHDGNRLVRVDPHSGEILAKTFLVAPTDVVAGFDHVWVVSERFKVVELDPRTLKVERTIRIPAGHAIAAAFGSIWVSGGDQSDVVSRIDPGTGRVVARVSTDDAGFPDRMVQSHGLLWVGQFQEKAAIGIDPQTNKVVARLPTGYGAAVVATGEGDLWAANYYDNTVWRLKVPQK